MNGSGSSAFTDIIREPKDIGAGSDVTVWPDWWPLGIAETANDFVRENFVQGHLLSQKLGGPGNNRKNLTPLTRSANSQMFHYIEKPITKLIRAGTPFRYYVEAEYDTHPTIEGVGAEELDETEQEKLKTLLDKMPGKIFSQVTKFKKGTQTKYTKQPKAKTVENEGVAFRGGLTEGLS